MKRPTTALTHDWIWGAIDALARERALTPSALARLAGLDPTTFNPSKRFTSEGRPRWPSTESLSKLLAATSLSLDEFAALEIVTSEPTTHPATAVAQPPCTHPTCGPSTLFRIGRAR